MTDYKPRVGDKVECRNVHLYAVGNVIQHILTN